MEEGGSPADGRAHGNGSVREPTHGSGLVLPIALISEGAKQMQYGTLWMLLFPLFFFVITLFAFFFVGDGLRDALDPKDR